MLAVCVGTGTEIGKTWVGAAVLSSLHSRGVFVAARKPVQSFDTTDAAPTDADVLAHATGEHPNYVCPEHRSYAAALAPPMAAAVLVRPEFTVAQLVTELRWPSPRPTVRWVETVGGVRSPIAFDGDSADLCAALDPDLVASSPTPASARSTPCACQRLRSRRFRSLCTSTTGTARSSTS